MSVAQYGGVNKIQIILASLDSPVKLLYGFLLILVIVFSPSVPTEYRVFSDTILGKVLGIAVIYGVVRTMGWVYGLLTAVAFLLVLHGAPRLEYVEGFEGGGSINEKKVIGKRWFVEKVLGEHPKRIETDKVYTSAIEGISSNGLM